MGTSSIRSIDRESVVLTQGSPAAAVDRPQWTTRRTAEHDSGHWKNVCIDSYLLAAAASVPDRLALVDGDVHLTYAQTNARVSALGAGLQQLGVGKGDVVSWQLPNWHEGYLLHQALVRIGAVSNPIVPIYRRHEVEYILREAQSTVVVVPDEFRGYSHREMVEDIRTRVPGLKHVVTARPVNPVNGSPSFQDLLDCTMPMRSVDHSADDPVLLMYTSGTTAHPKGAIHTHNTLDYENRTIIDVFELTGDDVVFMPSPITHTTGLVYGVQLAPMLCAPIVLQDIWEPGRALGLIAEYRCTFTFAATPFLHAMLHHPDLDRFDTTSLRVVASGGADVPPQLVRDVSERFGCTTSRAYGSTEFPTLCTTGPHDPVDKGATTDGRPIAAAQYRIVDDLGVEVVPGETGEIVVRGPELFVGYLSAADNEGAFTDDGWFRTGDLGSADSDGYITIRGRKKDIILRGGENISVTEVENLLLEHPAVREVAVVAMPDPIMVERACAYVVATPGEQISLQNLCSFLEEHDLARQKLPERLELIAELPRTASGKVQKFHLRNLIRDQLAAEAGLTAR